MSDVRLADNGNDVVFVNGDLQIVTGREAVAQHLRIRLRFFRGTWFLNRLEGMPYYELILVKRVDIATITSIYQKVITETPGVATVENLRLDLDRVTRKLSVSFQATTTDGENLTFSDFIVN